MYEYILKFVGYGLNRESLHELPLAVMTDSDGQMEPYASMSNNKLKKYCKIGYAYNSLIFIIISWKIPYLLIISFCNNDMNTGGLASFPILISIQYLLGIKYFNGKHFYSRLHEENIKKRFNIYLMLSSLLGLILTITSIILLVCNINVFAYTAIYRNANIIQRIFLSILAFVDMLFSNQIMVINCCSFVSNLISHKSDIVELTQRIETNITDSTSTGIKIGTIAQDYSTIKDKYGDTIESTKLIFSSLNFLGFIHISFLIAMLNNNTYYVLHIIYAILFVCVDIIFINVLQTVKSSVSKINGIISSTPFIVSYFGIPDNTLLSNNENDDINTKINTMNENIKLNTYKLVMLDQNLDWFNFQYITNQEWDKYIVMGIEISDTKILGRIVGLILVLIIGKDLATLLNF